MIRTLTLAMAILLMAPAVFAETVREVFDQSWAVRPGGRLTLDNTNGKVVVQAWQEPKVRIRAVKETQSRDGDEARKAMSEFKIDVKQTNDGLQVDTRYPKRRGDSVFDWVAGTSVSANASYEVWVPASLNLEIDTVNGGVRVSGVSGVMELDTVNGTIDVAKCSGAVNAETTNGAIEVELLSAARGQAMTLETTNGKIALAVPANFAATVDARTTNGSISSDLAMTVEQKSRNTLRGAINGGGAALRMRTTNGSIQVSQSGS